MVLVREFTSIFISTRRQLFILAAGVANHSANSSTEYEGAIKRSDETASHLEGKGQEPRKDYVRVGKDRWFRPSKATSDNYLPQRHSVLINSSAAFKATLPDLIREYGPPNVCQRLYHKRKEERRI